MSIVFQYLLHIFGIHLRKESETGVWYCRLWLYPLFYCGLFKLDLLTDFIGQFKRPEVCLSANRNQ
jgi:hypothetical protein